MLRPGASRVHVCHRARALRILGSKLLQIKACGPHEIVHLAVEMEAAALYAFAKARGRPGLCFAHVTNQMGRIEGDFEKGVADGAEESLKVIALTAGGWRAERPS